MVRPPAKFDDGDRATVAGVEFAEIKHLRLQTLDCCQLTLRQRSMGAPMASVVAMVVLVAVGVVAGIVLEAGVVVVADAVVVDDDAVVAAVMAADEDNKVCAAWYAEADDSSADYCHW